MNYLTSTRGAAAARIVERLSGGNRVTHVRAGVAEGLQMLRRVRRRVARDLRRKAEEVAGIVVAALAALVRLQWQRVITC